MDLGFRAEGLGFRLEPVNLNQAGQYPRKMHLTQFGIVVSLHAFSKSDLPGFLVISPRVHTAQSFAWSRDHPDCKSGSECNFDSSYITYFSYVIIASCRLLTATTMLHLLSTCCRRVSMWPQQVALDSFPKPSKTARPQMSKPEW